MATSDSTSETFTIPLTQEQVTFVDIIDADLAELKWYASFNPTYANNGAYVAIRNKPRANGKRGHDYMHRVIMERMLGRTLTSAESVDHKNLNTLDNRRENLRLATPSQNTANQGLRKNNTSGYKGVQFKNGYWVADISKDYKKYHIGTFNTIEEAYAAYCAKAKEFQGEFARLEQADNLPMPQPRKAFITDTSEQRFCAYCNKPLTKKIRSSGKLETPSIFMRRKYCDHACVNNDRRRK